MKITRTLLSLSAIAALSFGFTACGGDDDSNESGGETQKCTAAQNTCEGNTAKYCDVTTGEMKATICPSACANGQCVTPSTESCTGDAAMCDGNSLKVCNGSTFVITECPTGTTCSAAQKQCVSSSAPVEDTCDDNNKCPASYTNSCVGKTIYSTCDNGCLKIAKCDDGKICDPKTGGCVNECDSSFVKTCNDAGSTKACGADGAFVIESCGAGMKCDNGSCVEDTSAAVKTDTIIGQPCSGTGKITISNAELKSAMSPTVTGMLDMLKIELPDRDVVTAPNYFENISGCEGLTAPDGMSVGCFFTDTITFPSSITNLTDKVTEVLNSPFVQGFLGGADMSKINLDAILAAIKDLLGKGIEFKADKGYCMVADIDIDISFPSSSMVATFIDQNKLNELVNKINTPTHDHEKAKMAACPDGSTLISFGVNEESEAGTANVGFDICLKTCASDNDCRKDDGYTCVDLPRNSAEVEADKASAKVCFPEANITYFTKMTEDFEKLLPED